MTFTSPHFLLLLVVLPLLIWLGWPSRTSGRRRETVSLGVRVLIALLLIFALAGMEVRRPGGELSVVYLVDHSDSMAPAAQQLELNYVRQALRRMGARDKSAVIVFGGDAVVERLLSSSAALEGLTSKVTTIQTDLAEAIRLGLALLPPDTARRMVILSDGLETTGQAVQAARLAAASGVQILVVPLVSRTGAEVVVTVVNAPPHLREGEQFGLEVTIESTVEQAVGVRVLAAGAVAHAGTLQLRRGTNAFTLPMTAGAPGFAEYRLQIVPLAGADTFYQNNELAAFSQVAGPPRVLLIKNPAPRDDVDETRELVAALSAANWVVDVKEPAQLPSQLEALAEYASLILVDVPARDLSQRQMEAVQTYVRDLGGGLVAVGGPTAYGVGGYFRTPLEAALPVEMQIKDQLRRPRLTIVFIVDKSGSMADNSGGVSKVELAKEAAIRSLELLSPTDKVGVIAFDDAAAWVVPITTLEQHDAIVNAIGTIRADGGTDILAGVRAASTVLPNDDSAVKHIILLTDGGADPTGIAEVIRGMHDDHGITLSTVGVGQDAAPFLPELAAAGGGLYHFAADPASVPSIFAEETTLATRAYIIEKEFLPQQMLPSPMLAGIDSVYTLLGYVGTTAKDSAQAILVSDQTDPILASWQYGLGRAVAWTSDATGRWAKNWVTWDQFARFWAQVVRFTISDGVQSNVDVRIERTGDQAAVTVDARATDGDYLNGLTMQVNVVGPDGQTQAVTLQQSAPGRYIGAFVPATQGAYLIRVAGSAPQQATTDPAAVAQTAGWVLSYSPEYQTLGADPNFLARLAGVTGGHALSIDQEATDIYAHNLPAARAATRPVWPALLWLAALLLPVDVGVRRLVITRYELTRGLLRVRARLGPRLPQESAVQRQRSQRLTALLTAKTRAGASTRVQPDGHEDGPPPILTHAATEPGNSDLPGAPVSAGAARPLTSDGFSTTTAPEKPEPAQLADGVSKPSPDALGGPLRSPASASTSAALLARKRARDRKGD